MACVAAVLARKRPPARQRRTRPAHGARAATRDEVDDVAAVGLRQVQLSEELQVERATVWSDDDADFTRAQRRAHSRIVDGVDVARNFFTLQQLLQVRRAGSSVTIPRMLKRIVIVVVVVVATAAASAVTLACTGPVVIVLGDSERTIECSVQDEDSPGVVFRIPEGKPASGRINVTVPQTPPRVVE